MGEAYPQLVEQQDAIARSIESEEKSFANTIGRGIALFDEVVVGLNASGGTRIPGSDVFKLYDTYGFPADLTAVMASEQGLETDLAGFETLMHEKQEHERAIRQAGGTPGEADLVADLVAAGVTTAFVGYDQTDVAGRVLEIVMDGQRVEAAEAGGEVVVLLDQTTFYGESGGQMGDTGILYGEGVRVRIENTRKPAAGLFFHVGSVEDGTLVKGQSLTASVDGERRRNLARHHSATHILNHALRTVLNGSIKQAGSHVAPDRLRFDFTHPEAIKADQLETIEEMVNCCIADAAPVKTYEMALKDVQGSGIVAAFDEKYGETVRVVDIGGYSRELCGGTHVSQVGELGGFRVLAESSVASGVRRIEAVCAAPAAAYSLKEHALLKQASALLSVTVDEVPHRIEALLKQQKSLEKQLKEQQAEAARGAAGDMMHAMETVGGIPLLVQFVEGQNMDGLRSMLDGLRDRTGETLILLGGNGEGKAAFVAAVPEAAVAKGLHAGHLIKTVAQHCGGNGGGRPDKAQAGGKDGQKVQEAIKTALDLIRTQLA